MRQFQIYGVSLKDQKCSMVLPLEATTKPAALKAFYAYVAASGDRPHRHADWQFRLERVELLAEAQGKGL